MPGLAFTTTGTRLGRGKGFYDKYLADLKHHGNVPRTMALLYLEQLVDHVPNTEQDVPIDELIFPTESEINST